jgi:hypothetical protein
MRHLFYLVTDDDECFDETRCTIFNDEDAEEAFKYADLDPERGIYLLDVDVPSKFDFTPLQQCDFIRYGRGELDRFDITLEPEYYDSESDEVYSVMFKVDKVMLEKAR